MKMNETERSALEQLHAIKRAAKGLSESLQDMSFLVGVQGGEHVLIELHEAAHHADMAEGYAEGAVIAMKDDGGSQ